MLLAAIGWVLRPYLQSKPQPRTAYSGPRHVISSPLSLWASRSDKNVTVSWDSRRPAIAEARVAVLSIKDNDSKKEIPLTRNQLRTNELVYAATGDSIEISLEVFAESGKPTLESILLSTSGETSARSRSSSEVVVLRTDHPAPAPTHQEVPAIETSRPVRTFTATRAATPIQPRAVVMSDPPPPGPLPVVDPATLRTPEFLQPPLPLSPQKSENRASRPMSVQPPTPLRQVMPVAPSNILGFLRSPVTVRIRVSIDSNGKVVNAVPMAPPGGVNQYLAESAASAARMWTFIPARRGDTRLASETVLNFSFSPKR